MARKWSIKIKEKQEKEIFTWQENLSNLESDIENCIADGYTRGKVSIVM